MKKYFYTALIACCASFSFGEALAQTVQGSSMTDQQILEYVTKASEQGITQQQITKQLMLSGVTSEQLRRVRTKYQNGDQQVGSKTQAATSSEAGNAALRESNGELTLLNESATATIEEVLNIDNEAETDNRKDQIFGHDIFNNSRLTFEPNMNIAAPQDYVLGPGDEVVVDIFGATQVSIHQFVNSEGVIVIDQYGPLSVGGFTLAQADKLIRREVGAMYESSAVRVSVGQTRTIQINVMGEVNVPGTYRLSAFSTVFHALYAASGINDLGTLRSIKVYRGGREVTTVDVYEYILNGKLAGDVKLQDNDVIIVGPYENIVTADGSIKRPMKYEMKKGESLKHLIKYVGGFEAGAYTDAVRVMRSNGKRSTAYNVTARESGAFELQNGDIVTIDKHQDRFENIAEVRGAAFRPGIFHIGEGINTVRQIIEAADGLTETAVAEHVLLYRMNEDRTHTMISVDLKGILAGTITDMPLESEDILYIPSNEEALNRRTVDIQGEVFNPGTYDYADNTTLEALILQAGGLLESASTARVDVARYINDPSTTEITGEDRAQFMTFELQNGLLINPDPSFHLEPYDQVYVRRSPTYNEPQTVEVQGQVMFAGIYALSRYNERISDVIAKAGGLKQFAYAKGASLKRHLTAEEIYRIDNQIEEAQFVNDTLRLIQLRQQRNSLYNVGIDLQKAIDNPGSAYDLVLNPGDVLNIPHFDNSVKISGEVFYPNTISFEEGKNAKYYINQAGGYAEQAMKRKGYIIYKNGRVARIRKGAKVEPGCEIVIPRHEKVDYSAKTTTYVAIASSVATTAALLFNIFK